MAKRKRILIGKTTPSYSLKDAKKSIKKKKIILLQKVIESTNNMCLTISQAHQEILKLKARDFYKSVPDKRNNNIWQDVYKKEIKGFPIYIKFKIVGGNFLLMSFKPDESK